jgi:multidrug efflux pump subunit AcrB
MLGIIRVALQRPLTFIVLALAILIFGTLAWIRTPTDIFPNIGVPVIATVWGYNGLSPDEMAGRITTPYERILSTTVNDIEHIESQSTTGSAVVKIYFQPNVDIRTATAQVTSVAQTTVRGMPQGTTPPLILNYSASTVPILQIALSSKTLPEQRLADLAQNTIRPNLVSVPGAAIPRPFGGRERQVVLDLDPLALQARGLSAQDVSAAIAAQTQNTPVGQAKIGDVQYNLALNNTPKAIEDLNDLPVRTIGGATIFVRDIGHVYDGSAPQTNVVHVDGKRAVLMTIMKAGSTSTIAIVDGVKAALVKVGAILPPELNVAPLNDQSLFVKASVSGVVKEGALAAALTSLMILLFLGSWRSTVIIAASIPLAVLAAVATLSATGQTLNIMTLGGLALAVGILVDDATVTIENINWHLEQGKDVRTAILDGGRQIVGPAFVSLLCICVVFVPMFALQGVAGFLFVPMALSVVFAMIASFVLSRTFVPTMAMYLLKPHQPSHAAHVLGTEAALGGPHRRANPFVAFQRRFEGRFEKVRDGYRHLLAMALDRKRVFIGGFLAFVMASFLLVPMLGANFFPNVDTGQIALHVRAPVGSRIEETSAVVARVSAIIRRVIPADEIATMIDNIGAPGGINATYNTSGSIGPSDADVLISLNEHRSRKTADYVDELRRVLPTQEPGSTYAFLPADIVSQILNFGSPAALDIQVAGPNRPANEAYAKKLLRLISAVPGVVDARIQQSARAPQLEIDVDRAQIARMGLTERDVTASMGTMVAGSSQSAPSFFLNPTNQVSYPIVVKTPERQLDTLSALESLPVTSASGGQGGLQVLGGISTITRNQANAVVSHYDIAQTIDIYASPHGRDLAGVARDIQKIIDKEQKGAPKGVTITLRGQVDTMNSAFGGLFFGLIGAVVLIYLLIVVNFQSWLDPFVIITALPAALAGIVWMLFATGTTLSVPALTGAIMCMGVATANSILVVSFARERLALHGDPAVAAVEAGFTRFRPSRTRRWAVR